MADPRPLNRSELAKFLPDQRAIRAFEKLFELIPSDLEDLLMLSQSALLALQAVRGEVTSLKREVTDLEVELNALTNYRRETLALKSQLESLKQELQAAGRGPNLDPLIKRIELLETLEG